MTRFVQRRLWLSGDWVAYIVQGCFGFGVSRSRVHGQGLFKVVQGSGLGIIQGKGQF